MSEIDQLRQSVSHLVGLASGIPNAKIQFVQGGEIPQIPGSYCTIKLLTERTLGVPSPRFVASSVENVLDQEIRFSTEFQLSVNFYRDDALQYARNMKTAAFRHDIQAHLHRNKLGWLRYGPVNDLTEFFSGWYEERAQADMVMLVDGLDIAQVNQALSVDINIAE